MWFFIYIKEKHYIFGKVTLQPIILRADNATLSLFLSHAPAPPRTMRSAAANMSR